MAQSRYILITVYIGHDYDTDVILYSHIDKGVIKNALEDILLGNFTFHDTRDDDRMIVEVKPSCWDSIVPYLNTYTYIDTGTWTWMPVEIFLELVEDQY